MKSIALVMGVKVGDVQAEMKANECFLPPFDYIQFIDGKVTDIEKWKKAVVNASPGAFGEHIDIIGFFHVDEQIEGPLEEALIKMKAENKRVVLMPHEREQTTYRLRLARTPLPEHLEDFLWPTVDPSKLMGLVNYHGFVAENVFTSGGPQVEHKPPHEESGVLLAAKLVREGEHSQELGEFDRAFSEFAQATLAFPLPEAFYGLAACAKEKVGKTQEVLVLLEKGLKAADEIMNILPWQMIDRYVWAADEGLRLCTTKAGFDLERAKKFLRIGQREVPNLEHWQHEAENIERLEWSEKWTAVRFDDATTNEIVAPLLGMIDKYKTGQEQYVEVFSNAAKATKVSYILPLDRCPSLDSAELAGLYRAKGLIAVSEFQAEQYRRMYPFLPADFVKVCPLGFNTKLEQDVGKMSEWIAVSDVPNDVEQEIIDRANLDVRGPGEDLYLERSKIFLHIPLDEPYFCEEVLRAQAAGAVPVVAAVGCLPELVKGGYCIRPPVTSEAFIEAAVKRIIYLLMHESDRQAVAEEGKRRVLAENTWEAVAPTWRKALT